MARHSRCGGYGWAAGPWPAREDSHAEGESTRNWQGPGSHCLPAHVDGILYGERAVFSRHSAVVFRVADLLLRRLRSEAISAATGTDRLLGVDGTRSAAHGLGRVVDIHLHDPVG